MAEVTTAILSLVQVGLLIGCYLLLGRAVRALENQTPPSPLLPFPEEGRRGKTMWD